MPQAVHLEEVVLNNKYTGVSSDLNQAMSMALMMVEIAGMGEKLTSRLATEFAFPNTETGRWKQWKESRGSPVSRRAISQIQERVRPAGQAQAPAKPVPSPPRAESSCSDCAARLAPREFRKARMFRAQRFCALVRHRHGGVGPCPPSARTSADHKRLKRASASFAAAFRQCRCPIDSAS